MGDKKIKKRRRQLQNRRRKRKKHRHTPVVEEANVAEPAKPDRDLRRADEKACVKGKRAEAE
jgi:hypothetical protein